MTDHTKRGLIYCAECMNCRIFREISTNGRYIIKARCAKGRWIRNKKETTSEFHLITTRTRKRCRGYESTSETKKEKLAFVAALKKTLPIERHVYEADGSYVSKVSNVEAACHASVI